MKKLKFEIIFLVAYVVLLVSRIDVLTGSVFTKIDSRLIETGYIFITLAIILCDSKGVIKSSLFRIDLIVFIMVLHCLLFGKVLINSNYSKYINSQFNSQFIFCIIIVITIFGIKYFDNIDRFIISSFYAMSGMLTIKVLMNISELNLKNVINVFNISERTRANFGFGHYNTLGSACLCIIILAYFIYERKKKLTIMEKCIVVEATIIMLCSASRGAITGAMVFFVIALSQSIYKIGLPKKSIFIVNLIEVIVIVFGIYYAMGLNINELLKESQRQHLFKEVIPLYLSSGRIVTGVGYASNLYYGEGDILGKVLWLDNAYIYYLVTTGVLGLILIVSCLIIIFIYMYKHRREEYSGIFALICTYLYRGLFEVNLFESGYMMNYIYIPIFAYYIYIEKKHKRIG